MASPVLATLIFVLGTAVANTKAEGLWVANQARYECDDNNDGSTARVVACVPSNNLGGKEYAIGESWLGSEYRYVCVKTYPMQLALQKIGCVTPLGEELQPGNVSTVPDKGQYKCVTKGRDKEVFLEYSLGCYYNSRLYAPDETLRSGTTVLACKPNGQNGYGVRAIACVWTNDTAIPTGDFLQSAPGKYSKCQLGADNLTAIFVAATEKEYKDWLGASVHTTLAVPTTSTTRKTTTKLATIPVRTTTRSKKDCRDKHPLCHDLCTYPCFEDPGPESSAHVLNIHRGFPPAPMASWPGNGYGYVVNAPNQVQWVQQSWNDVVPGNHWDNMVQGHPWNNVPGNPWQPIPPGQQPWWPGQPWGRPQPTTTTRRPPPGLCHLWTTLGKEGVERMCPKSCQVIGCKYENVA